MAWLFSLCVAGRVGGCRAGTGWGLGGGSVGLGVVAKCVVELIVAGRQLQRLIEQCPSLI